MAALSKRIIFNFLGGMILFSIPMKLMALAFEVKSEVIVQPHYIQPVSLGTNQLQKIPINVYANEQDDQSHQFMIEDLAYTNQKLRVCGVQVEIHKIYRYQADQAFLDFESVEFNSGRVTAHEALLFSQVNPINPAVILVNALDWTIGEHGTVAVGYPQFYLNRNSQWDQLEKKFYQENMLGHSVLGKSRQKWTLVHEIGHTLFNLSHVEDTSNIMHPVGQERLAAAQFTLSQCQKGLAYYHHFKRNVR